MAKPVMKAFNQGEVPTIAVFNTATVPLAGEVPMGGGYDFDQLIAAMQSYIDNYIVPHWSTPAKLMKATGFVKGCWAMVFMDNADAPGALAYHDLTPDGFPIAKVFVKTTLADREQVSVSASHEIAEMLPDPAINIMTTGPNPKLTYAYELGDPVESLSFPVNGIPMSNFVYPSYFENFRKAGSVKFDAMGAVTKPFQILKGGYQIVFNGKRWTQIYGSKAKEKAFKKEDRRGHRSEYRKGFRGDPKKRAWVTA